MPCTATRSASAPTRSSATRTTLEINFAGFGLSANMQFGADTDFIAAGAVIGPSVPEPASVVLMAAGVALLGLRRFRLPQAG